MKQKMVFVGMSYGVGLFLASCFTELAGILLPLLAATILIPLKLLRKWKWRVILTVLVSFTVGVVWYFGYTAIAYKPIVQYQGTETVFVGRVTKQTVYNQDKASYQLSGTFRNGERGKLLCYTDDLDCEYGDTLVVCGKLELPHSDYIFSSESYYRSNEIFLEAASNAKVFSIPANPATNDSFQRRISRYKERLQKNILYFAGSRNGGVMISMTFGEKQFLDDTMKSAFLSSGISHVLAVLGFHMMILLLPISLLKRKRLFRFVQFFLSIGVVIAFALFTDNDIPVLRAGSMVLLMQISPLFYRKNNALNTLSIAVLFLTMLHPYWIRNPSFLLTISGTFGIGVLAPYLTGRLHPKHFFSFIGKRFLEMGVVFLCVLPVSTLFFSESSALSPLTNVLLIPFCSMIFIGTMMAVLLGCEGWLAEVFLYLASQVCNVLIAATVWIQNHIPATIPLGWEALPYLFLCSILIIFLVYVLFHRRGAVAVVLCGQIFVLLMAQAAANLYRKEQFQIAVLGKGTEAVIVVQYHGNTDVIDVTGHYKNPKYVQTYLERNGIHKIQSLVILKNVPQMYALYKETLPHTQAGAVLLPQNSFYRPQDVICGTAATRMDAFRIIEPEYEIEYLDSVFKVCYAGREVVLCFSDIALAMESDLSLLEKDKMWILAEERGKKFTALCTGDDLWMQIETDGTVHARRL